MKPTTVLMTLKLTCIFMLICAQLGCQHAPIKFTASAPPSLPDFDGLPAAPKVAPLQTTRMAPPLTRQLTANSFLHQWPQTVSHNDQLGELQSNSLYLIGILKSTAIENPDILVAAFKQQRKTIANTTGLTASEAACYDSMRFRASLHSVGITINCVASTSVKSKLLWQFWDDHELDDVNIESIQRSLKLNKHIGAFTGSEIDMVFRKKLLGEHHPYNQNIDNSKLIDELDSDKLSSIHLQLREQMQWHLFTHQHTLIAENDTHHVPLLASTPYWLSQEPSNNLSKNKTTADKRLTNRGERVLPTPEQQKTLYLIDAPDTVQTQVRLGVLTNSPDPKAQDASQCKILSALLGRGYSGRLFYDLRETRGLTYGVYGGCVDAPLSQYMYFYGSTALANSGAFLKGMTDHLALISEQLTPQKEINSAATYLIGKQQLTIDRPFGKESLYINQILRNKALKNKQPLAQQLKNQALDSQASTEIDQGLMQLSKLTPQELLVMTQAATLNDPIIVLRGDADKITIDLQQKFPTWQIKLVEVD